MSTHIVVSSSVNDVQIFDVFNRLNIEEVIM